jgi:hypothetical protein
MTREEWDKLTPEQQFEYVQLCDAEIERYKEVLLLMPPCPEHGQLCLPRYQHWLVDIQAKVMS